jgi:hypothetical protein
MRKEIVGVCQLSGCKPRAFLAENDVNHRAAKFRELGPQRASSRGFMHPTFLFISISDDTPLTMRDQLERWSAPPKQLLRVLQPTAYTASYTVSTRPVPRTVPAQIASYIGILSRTIVGLATALLLWLASGIKREQTEDILLHVLDRFRLDQVLTLVAKCQWLYLAPCALIVLVVVFRRNYTGTYTSAAQKDLYLTHAQKSLSPYCAALAFRRRRLLRHIFKHPRPASYRRLASRTFSYTRPSRGSKSGSTWL